MKKAKRGKKAEKSAEAKKPRLEIGVEYPLFTRRFRDAMNEMSWDDNDLIGQISLSRPTVKRLLEGIGNPQISNLLEIADKLGVTLTQLLGPRRADAVCPDPEAPLVGEAPTGDPTARWVYERLCEGEDPQKLQSQLVLGSYPFPGEPPGDVLARSVIDCFAFRQAWIPADRVPRCLDLERAVAKKYQLAECGDLVDRSPVRVIDVGDELHPLVRLYAVAAVAAEVSRELMVRSRTLGFGDGFAVAAWQQFLRRGALSKVELVPLTIVPTFTQFELNANSIAAMLMRTHYGYHVGSAIELTDLKSRIREIDHAVVSCGPGVPEDKARLPRLIKESSLEYGKFFADLKKKGVVGDLLYHFLDAEGNPVHFPKITGDLSLVEPATLRSLKKGPLVFSTPLDELAGIVERGGVSLVQAHQENRAGVLRAALRRERRPVNFLVIPRDLARGLLADD